LQKSDRYAALFFMAFSLFICQQAVVIGVGSLRKPGPGLLAFGAGAGIGLLAFVVLIRSLLSKREPVEGDQNEGTIHKGKFLLICISLFVYAVLVNWLGFVLSTFLFVFFLLQTIQSERWWRSLVKSVLITAGNYLVFVLWLGINLPGGFWAG
jgi:putative tricarboxylic transport membrane protein